MRYEFIVFELKQKGQVKQFEMFHIQNYSDVVEAMQKLIGVSLMKNLFDEHTLRDVKKIPGTDIIKPGVAQTFLDPMRVGNRVFVDLCERIWQKKQTVIMNKDGGYQPFEPDKLSSIGWAEIRRELRETLSFHKYEKAPV